MPEREIFANYEIDNSRWKKIMLGLLGGSLVLHVILFLSTVYVPSIRDAFYVAILFSDAPTAWENKAYKKTEIAEEVTVINLPSGPLYYPAGYFELANGDAPAPDYASMVTPYTPIAIDSENSFPPLQFDQPKPLPPLPPLPRPRNSTVGALPKLPKPKKGAKIEESTVNDETESSEAETTASPTPKEEVARMQPSPSPSPNNSSEIKLNQQPLLKIADEAIKKIENKQIDLNKPVNVTVKGVLGDDGKFIGATTYKNNGGDEKLALMASELIAAMNDSGMLSYVKLLSSGTTKRDVTFNISKDDKEVKFQLVSVVGTNAKANSLATELGILMFGFKLAKEGTEEGEILEKLQLTSDKNQVVINWMMDTPTAMKKIQNKLAEVQKKKQQPSTQNTNTNLNTSKE